MDNTLLFFLQLFTQRDSRKQKYLLNQSDHVCMLKTLQRFIKPTPKKSKVIICLLCPEVTLPWFFTALPYLCFALDSLWLTLFFSKMPIACSPLREGNSITLVSVLIELRQERSWAFND